MATTFYSVHDVYLMHHGIKGQKWGVRRYQNPDGTLTKEGKERYGSLSSYYQKKTEMRNVGAVAASTAGILGSYAGAVGLMSSGMVPGGIAVWLGGVLASAIARGVIRRTGNTLSSYTRKGDRARKLVEEEGHARAAEILSTGVNNKEIADNTGDLTKYLRYAK